MFSKKLIVTCAAVGLLTAGSPAYAHGDIQASDPAPRSTVRRAPKSVAITFTEAPTAQAVLEVTDGCKREVGQGVDVAEATATVRVGDAQPGRWQVSYRVISAVDGHLTRGGYAFTVAGEKDCTPDEKPAKDPGDDPTRAAPPIDEEDEPEGSGAPVVPIAIGAVALIAVALIVRRSGSA
jgi:methionine-rich copper-binding protein CopC